MDLIPVDNEIYGEMGGKGGKGGHTPVESADTLSSNQVVKILLALGEGEFEGIQDILLNHVSISQFDASYVFRSGTASSGTGQTVIPGFVNTEAPYVGTFPAEVTVATPLAAYVMEAAADAARISFFVPALTHFLDNGDLVGTTVQLQVLTSPNNSTYTAVATTTKTGKASSDYTWDIQVEKPAGVTGASWYIKVVRITTDNSVLGVKYQNHTHISGITKLYYKNLIYPNTALLAITIRNAAQFGGSVPDILVKGKFRKVKIPDVYTPGATITVPGTYSGAWTTLQFKPTKYFTSDIAWIIFDVLNDSACLNIPQADIDIVSFYQLSQVASQTISDGYGGTIPRWYFGYQFVERDNIPSFLATLLAICNGKLTTNIFGQITIVYDYANKQPTKLITNSNVIDGLFNYSSNTREERTTVVNVTYNDYDNYGQTNTITVPNESPTTFEAGLITRYGIQPTDLILPGCRFKAQAQEKARWALYTNCKRTKFISFRVFLQGLTFFEGETIKIMDSDNQSTIQHGIISSSSQVAGVTTLNLSESITLSSGTWTINFTGTDGTTIYTKTIIQTNGTFTALTFNGTEVPFQDSVFILNGTVSAFNYDVVSVKKEDLYYNVFAVQRDEGLYSYVSSAASFTPVTGDFVNRNDFTVEAPINLVVSPISSSDGVNSNIQLHVSWDWDLDNSSKYKANFRASYRRDSQDFVQVLNIQGLSFDIDNAVPGTYEINVWAINPATGLFSTPLNYTYGYRTSAGNSTLLPPINASTSLSTTTLTFSSAALNLYFYNNPANDSNVVDSLYDYLIELWNTSGTTKYWTGSVEPTKLKDGTFTLTLAENISRFGSAQRQFQIKLYSRDLSGFLSTAYSVTVNNPVPAAISYTLTSGTGAAYINITSTPETDVVGYLVHRSTTAGFTPDGTNIFYDGPDTVPVIPGNSGTLYYYKLAAYDSFGKTGLNYGSQVSGSLLTATTDQFAFTGLTFSVASNIVSWTSGTVSLNGAAATTISAGNSTWSSGILYICYDKASSTLFSTNDLATAVTKSQILASYNNVTGLKGGDGTAFINGGQILGQSVGANQLVANTAIITNTLQVQSGLLTDLHVSNTANLSNAKIANDLQSSTWNTTAGTGWKIDKAGKIRSYGDFELVTSGVTLVPQLTLTPVALILAGNASKGAYAYKPGAVSAWDTQVNSVTGITGNCAVRAMFGDITKYKMFGLNAITDLTSSAADVFTYIDYAWYGQVSAVLSIYENGVGVNNPANGTNNWGTYSITDVLEIEYNGTNIIYKQNGVTKRTVSTTAGRTFYVDTAFFDQSSYIRNIEFGTYIASVFTPQELTLTGNATISQDAIFKLSGTAAFDTQAYSTTGLTSGAMLQFSSLQTGVDFMVGLNSDPTTDANYTSIDYAFYCTGNIAIYESGSPVNNPATGTNNWGVYTTSTVFKIIYYNDSVYYYVDNNLIRTVITTTGRTFYFDSSLLTVGIGIYNIFWGTPTFTSYIESGARLKIVGDNIKLYDSNNVLRIQIGNLAT